MKEHHNHSHSHNHNEAYKNIGIAFLLNLIFSIIEFIGSFFTNSISIFSDSIHDFGDSLSIFISYLLEKKSKKKPNEKYTYGYLRYSLFGALITSTILLVGSIIVIYNAIKRIITPEIINHDAMIIFAIFGIIINGYAAYRTSKGEKHNEKAINLHMLEDVFGWIAVLIGSILIKLFNFIIIDPILSILIAIYILYHVYKYMKEIFNILMEKTPDDIEINSIQANLKKEFNVINNIHHVHIWSLDGVNNYMTAHVQLNKDISKDEIIKLKQNIKDILKNYNINHTTIEIEFLNEICNSKKC